MVTGRLNPGQDDASANTPDNGLMIPQRPVSSSSGASQPLRNILRSNKIFQHNYVGRGGLPEFPLEAALTPGNLPLAAGNARKDRSFPEISSIVDVERRGQSLLNLLHGLP